MGLSDDKKIIKVEGLDQMYEYNENSALPQLEAQASCGFSANGGL